MDHAQGQYVEALGQEISRRSEAERPVRTLYLGGGTPSRLAPELLQRIFRDLSAAFDLESVEEVTLEANPEGVSPEAVALWAELGVNRVSLGAQSFLDRELTRMERVHDAAAIPQAVDILRKGGIPRFSLDLILGLPEGRLADFEFSLGSALELDPGHLSLYTLTIERGAPWGKQVLEDPSLTPDEDLQADMLELAFERTQAAGYRGYELANFARPGHESLHNLRYWRQESVLGLGVGAWGYDRGKRQRNSGDLESYIQDQNVPRGPFLVEELSQIERDRETLVLGLRLEAGVEIPPSLPRKEAQDVHSTLERFRELGLTQQREARWSLTPKGRLLAHEVMAELI